jgi:predicted DNA-binding transcriptional regulator YafY
MPIFTPSGDLLTDLNSCILNTTVMEISYTDRKGNYSTRTIAPLEVRGDSVYSWDIQKWGLRLFKLNGIGSFTVLEDTFDPNNFKT